MPEPRCQICSLLGDLEHTRLPLGDFLRRLRVASQIRCFCPDGKKHRPLFVCPHVQPGCIGYELPQVEIIGSIDRWEDTHAPHP